LVDRDDRAVLVPRAAVAVFERREVRAAGLPLDRRPQEKELRHLHARRTVHFGRTDRTDSPRAILGAEYALAIDRERLAVVADRSLPASVLREARRIHEDALAVVPRLTPFLHACRPCSKFEVDLDSRRIGFEAHARALHRLDDFDRKRTDHRLRRFARRAPRGMEAVLLAVTRNRKAAIENAAMRIQAHPDAEIELAVVRVAVEPVAIVDV